MMYYTSAIFNPTKYISDAFSDYATMAQKAVIDYLWTIPGAQAESITKITLGNKLAEKMNADLIALAEDTLQVCDPLSPGYIFSAHWKDVLQTDSDAIKHSVASKGIGLVETVAEGYAASALLAGIQYMAPQALVAMMPGGIFAQALAIGGPLACSILVHSVRKAAIGDTVAENFRLHNYSKFENPFGVEAIRKSDLDSYPEVSERLKNSQENINSLTDIIAENVFKIEKFLWLLNKEPPLKSTSRNRIDKKLQLELSHYETNVQSYSSSLVNVQDGFALLEKLNKAKFKAKAQDYETVKSNLSKAQTDISLLEKNVDVYKQRYQEYKQGRAQLSSPRKKIMQFSVADNKSQPTNDAPTIMSDKEINTKLTTHKKKP